MAFYGDKIIFDGVPSDYYNLYITAFESGEDVLETGSSDVELYTESIYRRPEPYLLGVKMSPPLTFNISLTSPMEITAPMYQAISKWLFGKQQYQKLQIIQDDMRNIYYNCILQQPRIRRSGNIVVGVDFTAICDAPWGWEFPKTLTKTYLNNVTVSDSFTFYNGSDHSGFLFPTLIITMNNSNGGISLKNVTENNRDFLFTGLTAGEIITVNNKLETITSSTGLIRLGNFNKKYFRLLSGNNALSLSGNISQLKMTYQFARKF